VVSDCPACTTAAQRVSHEFHAGCRGCCARAAGRSPQFAAARKAGVIDRPYRLLLEQFGLDHETVKAAVAADRASE
jgi:hypothetical protein